MTVKPRAVLFDLDETLYLERRFALSGFAAVARAVATQAGVRGSRDLYAARQRPSAEATARSPFSNCAQGWAGRSREWTDWSTLSKPRTEPPPAAPYTPTLDVLRAEWRLGIVTNGPVGIQAAKVEALGLEPLVDSVVFASSAAWVAASRRPRRS